MLKHDLFDHLIELGYNAPKDKYLREFLIIPEDNKSRWIWLEQTGFMLSVLCKIGHEVDVIITSYWTYNGKHIKPMSNLLYLNSSFRKLDSDIIKFLQPQSISFIQSLEEETC